MKSFSKVVSIGRKAACILLLTSLTGCWASKEETSMQLQRHINAYEETKITPVNAQSIIKGLDVLISSSEENNFRKAMDERQLAKLKGIKENATIVAACTDKLNSYAQSSERAKPNEIARWTISLLGSILRPLQETQDCIAKADVLNKEQVASLNSYTEEIGTALKKAEAAEVAKKAAEEAAKKAAAEAERRREAEAIAARESRVNRFMARTGMKPRDSGSYEVDKMRKDIDRAMLRTIEKNCEDWLPSSCEREYGITIYDFSLVREKLGFD
jgi:hypothetical protein